MSNCEYDHLRKVEKSKKSIFELQNKIMMIAKKTQYA